MDKNIGVLVDTLKRRGLYDNTLIVFFSDNGMPFPRAKGTLYDSGVGTPLTFTWPAGLKAGGVYTKLASVIDLAPTLLEAAGLTPRRVAPEMQGRSLFAQLFDTALPGRDYVFSERNWHNCDEHMRSVRTERYKLIRNAYLDLPHGTPADLGASPSFKALLAGKERGTLTPAQAQLFRVPRPRIELYDLVADPWETRNIASTDEGRSVASHLEKVLDEWGEETGDFPPSVRRRGDNTDRYTGVKFTRDIPEMTHIAPAGDPPS